MTEACKELMRQSSSMDAVANYLVVLFDQGDWLNDYLADVPECGQPLIMAAGQILAYALGF